MSTIKALQRVLNEESEVEITIKRGRREHQHFLSFDIKPAGEDCWTYQVYGKGAVSLLLESDLDLIGQYINACYDNLIKKRKGLL